MEDIRYARELETKKNPLDETTVGNLVTAFVNLLAAEEALQAPRPRPRFPTEVPKATLTYVSAISSSPSSGSMLSPTCKSYATKGLSMREQTELVTFVRKKTYIRADVAACENEKVTGTDQ